MSKLDEIINKTIEPITIEWQPLGKTTAITPSVYDFADALVEELKKEIGKEFKKDLLWWQITIDRIDLAYTKLKEDK